MEPFQTAVVKLILLSRASLDKAGFQLKLIMKEASMIDRTRDE
jgi:hypothetical protein